MGFVQVVNRLLSRDVTVVMLVSGYRAPFNIMQTFPFVSVEKQGY